MIKEAARVFLEDWFSEHPDTAEFFDEKGMDCLADIVEGAIEQEKDPVSADDVRVESLLGYFLAGAPSQLKSKFPASEFDATKLSDPLRADCKRVIAAALTMEQRRKDLLSDLSRSKISVSALSRATGMARSTLSSNKKLKTQLLSCLVDFMVEHATALERGTTVNPEVDGRVRHRRYHTPLHSEFGFPEHEKVQRARSNRGGPPRL